MTNPLPMVLVVDDDPIFCLGVETHLRGFAEVVAVRTYLEALTVLKSRRASVILVDHFLAGEDAGPILMPKLAPFAPPGKTFICSSLYSKADATSQLLPKPISRDMLLELLPKNKPI